MSALVTPKGEVLWSPYTDSHEDLVDLYELVDNGKTFCRLEFYPDDEKDIIDPKKYNLHIDQEPPR